MRRYCSRSQLLQEVFFKLFPGNIKCARELLDVCQLTDALGSQSTWAAALNSLRRIHGSLPTGQLCGVRGFRPLFAKSAISTYDWNPPIRDRPVECSTSRPLQLVPLPVSLRRARSRTRLGSCDRLKINPAVGARSPSPPRRHRFGLAGVKLQKPYLRPWPFCRPSV